VTACAFNDAQIAYYIPGIREAPLNSVSEELVPASHMHCEKSLGLLLLDGLDGNEDAYRLFLTSVVPCLRALSCSYLNREPNEVESFVQEILMALHQKRATYRKDISIVDWIYAIATYKLASSRQSGTSSTVSSKRTNASQFALFFLDPSAR
jgi:hypothetical protein